MLQNYWNDRKIKTAPYYIKKCHTEPQPVIFLDLTGKQIDNTDIINYYVNKKSFLPINIFKKGEENIYETYNYETDINNKCKPCLAHQLDPEKVPKD